ncbi:MAG: hypothetical protein EZS28_021324 [Streblomastix strix]|uniref:Tyr recombinase domain-containing protein n=1 Tax=Streblomastix strix TaxID=222440 RepID=A0A5J4VLC7_9EUKA|nr:MAG: hypothetical protein EZS28_021324 [Streblomastix strix]
MIAQLRNAGLSSSALLNVQKAISSLLISQKEYCKKVVKDKDTYGIDDLLCYIRRRVEQIDDMEDEELDYITLALLMSIKTRRMAEISRAELEVATMTSEQFDLKYDIQKVGGGKVTLIIKRAKDYTICPPASADTCSKLTKQITKAVGLPYCERITELRAAAITKMIKFGYPKSAINAWSIHSNTVRKLQKYYCRSNCSEIIDQLLNTSERNRKKYIIEDEQLQTITQQLMKDKLQKRIPCNGTQSSSIIALKKRKKKQQ